jgi:hypothetical protein
MKIEGPVVKSPETSEPSASTPWTVFWRRVVFVPLLLLVVAFGLHLHFRWKTERYRKSLEAGGLELKSFDPRNTLYRTEGNADEVVKDSITSIAPFPSNLDSGMILLRPSVARFAHTQIHPGPGGEDLWGAGEEWARREMPAFLQLHSVLTNSHLTFHLNYQLGPLMPMNHLAAVKKLAASLSAHTYGCIRLGETNVAFTNLLTSAHLIGIFTNEPVTISQLVRVAFAKNYTWDATWEAVESGILNESQLAELQQRWEKLDFIAGFRLAHLHDLSNLPTSYQQMRDSHEFFKQATGFGSQGLLTELQQAGSQVLKDPLAAVKKVSVGVGLYPAWKFYASYPEELAVMKKMVRAVEVMESTLQNRIFPPEEAELPTVIGVAVGSLDFRHIHLRAVTMQVRKECLVAAVAAHRYKFKHGNFPARLEDLVPEFVSSLPHDWMSGKPLRYRLLENGRFLVYSVGEDRVDNGGDAPPENGKSLRNLPDIAWPQPATLGEVEAFDKKQKAKSRSISSNGN